MDRAELAGPAKPLAKERWAGGIDSVGSTTLANLLSMTKYGGAIAARGPAAGIGPPTSGAPFFFSGGCLLGLCSLLCPRQQRKNARRRPAGDPERAKTASNTTE